VRGSIAPGRFHELGWRVLAYAACTHFRTASLAEGATLAGAIAKLAEGSGRRPDVDLRSDGVTVRLKVSETGELSEGDVALAREISTAARELSLPVDLTGLQSYQIAIDALVIPDVMPFWAAVLGYLQIADILVDPHFEGPTIWFQQMDVPRPQRNRIHIDLYMPEDQAHARIQAAVAAGGRVVNDAHAPDGGRSPTPRATRWTLPPGRTRGRNPLATLG
jgi:4a-hydroxytetrahydrobiopterin dehydratase